MAWDGKPRMRAPDQVQVYNFTLVGVTGESWRGQITALPHSAFNRECRHRNSTSNPDDRANSGGGCLIGEPTSASMGAPITSIAVRELCR